MSAIKSFLTFTSTGIKRFYLLMPFAVPLLAFAAARLFLRLHQGVWMWEEDILAWQVSFYTACLIAVPEIIWDYAAFGGSFAPHASRMEYLKCAPNGMAFYRSVLLGSVYWRFLYFLTVNGIFWLVWFLLLKGSAASFAENWLFFSCAVFASVQLCALINRRITVDSVALAISTSGGMVLLCALSAAAFLGKTSFARTVLVCAAALVAGGLLSRLLVRKGLKKKKEEYYDV